MGKLYTGAEFNKEHAGVRFVKLTYENEVHHDFQFKDGLNADILPFNTVFDKSAGGLYFCRFDQALEWLFFSWSPLHWYRFVEIPDDAKVYVEDENRIKANKIILGTRQPIENLPNYEKYCVEQLRHYPHWLKCVKHQTLPMYETIIQCDPSYYPYILNPTQEINKALVKVNGRIVELIEKPNEELFILALML